MILKKSEHIQSNSAEVASKWFFPFVILTMVLGNQPYLIANIVSQIIGWLTIICAVMIVLDSFKQKKFIFIIISIILIAKLLRIVSASSTYETVYIVFLNTLFCIAGSVVCFVLPDLIYRQVMNFCLINFIVMTFQVTGVGGVWGQLLTTHGEGNLTVPVSTLFVDGPNFQYLVVQGRPAGLSYSNVILSLIILFAIVLHFSRTKNLYNWGTPLLCGIIVLSMAKMAFFGFIIAIILLLFFGEKVHRIRILKAAGLVILFLGLYFELFPGLASTNLAKETIDASIFLRANEIMSSLNPDLFTGEKMPYFEGTQYFYTGEEGEFVSGYASLIVKIYNNLFLFVFGVVLGSGIYLHTLFKLKKNISKINLKIIMAIVIIGLFPLTHPIWPSQIYWFMLGLGLLPLYYYLQPRFIS